MRVTIFGDNWLIMKKSVEKALEQGHEVIAYFREASGETFLDKNLFLVEGNLEEIEKMSEVIIDANAVISLLAPAGRSKNDYISTGYTNIITLMQKEGPKRIIATILDDQRGESQSWLKQWTRYIKTLLPEVAKNDIQITGNLISKSQLQWTIINLPILFNENSNGTKIRYRGMGGFGFLKFNYDDFPGFLIDQLVSTDYLFQSLIIT